MSTPKPDQPCWCGSGQPYQLCHLAIDSVPVEKRLFAARAAYSKTWEQNANHFDGQSCYEWMAGLLSPFEPRRILDIGCGVGNGLAALIRKFPQATILSVDENPECIELAKCRLESKGASVSVVRRLKDRPTSARSHELRFEPGQLKVGSGVNLIESDMLIDQEFADFLASQPPFDAITVWLIGSHRLRYHECDNLAGRINSPGEYRLSVQNTAYKLADHLLKAGGVLQIVDRGEPPASELLKEDTLNSHRDQATLTDGRMVVTSLDYRLYSEPNVKKAVKMVLTIPTSGRISDAKETAMVSVISVRKQR